MIIRFTSSTILNIMEIYIFSKEYILVTTLSNLLPLKHGRVTDSQPIHPSPLLMNPVYPSIPSQMYPSQSESILAL